MNEFADLIYYTISALMRRTKNPKYRKKKMLKKKHFIYFLSYLSKKNVKLKYTLFSIFSNFYFKNIDFISIFTIRLACI